MTLEHVAVTVKASGPDPYVHVPVEVSWWNLASGEKGTFIPPHDPRATIARCDFPTINAINYTVRLAEAPQDKTGREAARLAAALKDAVLVTVAPFVDATLLHRMYAHYCTDFNVDQVLTTPQWHGALDAGAYAAGVLGLTTVPDLITICQLTDVPREAAGTAETDTDALGRAMLRLAELAHAAKHRQHAPTVAPASQELAAALAARMVRVPHDLVTVHDNGEIEIVAHVVQELADQTYGPAMVEQRGQYDQVLQQMREMADVTQRAANAYQATLDELRTLPLTEDMHALIKTAVDTAEDGETAATAVLEHVRSWLAADQSIINGLTEQNEKLDHELAEALESRKASAIASIDTELSAWEQLVVPATELSVGPDTGESALEATAPYRPFGDPATPLCLNTTCGHASARHDIEDYDDPIPTCGVEGCGCGHPPAGWRRALPVRYWQPGETVPPRVTVLGADGQVSVTGDEDWVNDTGTPVVEIVETDRHTVADADPVLDAVVEPAPVADHEPVAEVAG